MTFAELIDPRQLAAQLIAARLQLWDMQREVSAFREYVYGRPAGLAGLLALLLFPLLLRDLTLMEQEIEDCRSLCEALELIQRDVEDGRYDQASKLLVTTARRFHRVSMAAYPFPGHDPTATTVIRYARMETTITSIIAG